MAWTESSKPSGTWTESSKPSGSWNEQKQVTLGFGKEPFGKSFGFGGVGDSKGYRVTGWTEKTSYG